MGSLIMHIAASKIIAKKFNLSDKFIAGAIMPDIYAKCGIDRNKTHYIDLSNSNLPNFQKFIYQHQENISDELVLGYLAHLIEDYIWFGKFIDKYAKVISYNPEKIKYLNDGSIHTNEEFSSDIYKDYNCIDNYICEKYDIHIEEIKSNISKYYNEYESKEKLNKYLYLHKFDKNRNNIFLTEEQADSFVEVASSEVEKIIREFLIK